MTAPSAAERAEHRVEVRQWARNLLASTDWVILDSETTGLHDAEFVQLAIIDHAGAVLFDSLLKPSCEIEPGAAAVHGITTEQVAGAPTFAEVYDDLVDLLHGRRVLVYNAPFDWSVWRTAEQRVCDDRFIHPLWETDSCPWECVMLPYSRYVGIWNEKRNDYQWQKLPAGDHSALGDCQATLRLIRTLAEMADE